MIIRNATIDDRDMMLKSFKPLFGDWDYLPFVIDDWLGDCGEKITWLACDGPYNEVMVAMTQAYEIETGDWYLRGLRSNPGASYMQNALAVFSLAKVIKTELLSREAVQVRYGTLDYFEESLRLSEILGFEQHFRIAHAHHPMISDVLEIPTGVKISAPENIDEIYEYFKISESLAGTQGYFFTWWDTRPFSKAVLEKSAKMELLFEAREMGKLTGAVMLWHVDWQKHLVLSIMEGTTKSLFGLFSKSLEKAREYGSNSFGLSHSSHQEMYHRQTLFGLPNHGSYSVQLIRTKA